MKIGKLDVQLTELAPVGEVFRIKVKGGDRPCFHYNETTDELTLLVSKSTALLLVDHIDSELNWEGTK